MEDVSKNERTTSAPYQAKAKSEVVKMSFTNLQEQSDTFTKTLITLTNGTTQLTEVKSGVRGQDE